VTGLEKFIGEVLDGKYRLERQLGQGGMGAVYLATHLGTERPVALKLIAPQFMRHDEFVERFKREARAAGRLRHPNVVDVTDFGFAETGGERVAYLVMEYLDGCTLGDVLAEEKRLPLDWTINILEQVCSAVDEAHQQGIIHRDLKPDNIWLEPNRLGGYRVKVLDFGIAKLGTGGEEEAVAAVATQGEAARLAPQTHAPQTSSAQLESVQASIARAASSLRNATKSANGVASSEGAVRSEEAARPQPRDAQTEAATQLYAPAAAAQTPAAHDTRDEPHNADDEQGTRLFAPTPTGKDKHAQASGDAQGARASSDARDARALGDAKGAHATNPAHASRSTQVADEAEGTRLFDAQPRATGRESAFADAHTAAPSAALTRVGSIMGTPIYMSPEQCRGERLDARSDIYSLGVIAYQMLAGETPFVGDMVAVMRQHMTAKPTPLREKDKKVPKRVARVVMSALAKSPSERPASAASFANALSAGVGGIGMLLRRAFALYSEHFPVFLRLSLIAHLPFIFVSALLFVLDVLDLQHRSIFLYLAIAAPLGLLQFAVNFLGTSVISGVTTIIVTQLQLAPLRPVSLRAALKVLRRRWRPFLNTSIRITIRMIIGFALLFIPGFIMMVKYAFYAPVVLLEGLEKKAALRRSNELSRRSRWMVIALYLINMLLPIAVGALLGSLSVKAGRTGAHITTKASPRLFSLVNIVIVPLISITSALLYLKLRQMGGETMRETLEQFDDTDAPRARWQQRMRARLSGYTPQSRSRTGQPSDPSKLS
jgi:serine/threonine protein kinase